MTPLKPLILCSLLFIWGCSGIPAKAPDETFWYNDAFLREEQHMLQGGAITVSDKEINVTANKIWDSVEDLNVQYDGVRHGREPLKLFANGQTARELDPSFKDLLKFYEAKLGVVDPCVVSTNCSDAQKRFIDNISSQKDGPISILHKFLHDKGLFKKDYKAFKDSLRTMWFEAFSRSGGRLGKRDSSGFEHVFLGEITTEKTFSGLHNWMRMYDGEHEGRFHLTHNAKYFPKEQPFVAYVEFTWNLKDKPETTYKKTPGSTFFMKKSPAVEIALYTLCFMARPGEPCSINFGTGVVNVRAIPLKDKKEIISTAFPDFR